MQLFPHLIDMYRERNAVMNNNTTNQNWEQVFKVIQKSFSVQKHVDFFNWLQGSVNKEELRL